MKISIPTRFDDATVMEYQKINQEYASTGNQIYEVYGTLSTNPFGSARVSDKMPINHLESLEDHIRMCHKHNMRFNFTFNSPCLGNLEYTPKGQKQILQLVEQLVFRGVDAVTVSNIFLMDLIAEHFDIDIYVSIISNIDSPENAKFVANKGVKKIILSSDIYRDFETLKAIRNAVPTKLELIGNMFCIHNCPLRSYHYSTTGHAAQDPMVKPRDDYCSFNCSLRLLQDPRKILHIPMIRPEDMYYYQEIGIDSIKIAGRTASLNTLSSLAQLYMLESFPGDLGIFIDRRTVWRRIQRRLPAGTKLFQIEVNHEAFGKLVPQWIKRGCKGQCHKCNTCTDLVDELLHYDEDLRRIYLKELENMIKEQVRLDFKGEVEDEDSNEYSCRRRRNRPANGHPDDGSYFGRASTYL